MPVYMKIDGIKGEATEQKHKDWIEALSFTSPIHRKIPDGSFGNDAISRGFLVFNNIFLRRKVDCSSVPLAKGAALGKVHPTIEIHVTTPLNNGEVNLLEYKLTDAIIASHSVEVAAGGGSSQSLGESLEINFSKIEWKHNAYDSKGNPKGNTPGWYDRKDAKGG